MKIILMLVCILSCFPSHAQVKGESTTLLLLDKNYIEISIGKSNSKFRDFATSPLFYKGLPTAIGLRKTRDKNMTIVSMGMEYIFGNYQSNFNDHQATAQVRSLNLDYSRMYHSNLTRWDKTNLFLGGKVIGTANLRINESLLNNSVGFEMFANIMGSAMVRRDISRKRLKNKKFLFIKYKLKPRTRDLSYRFNLGVVNTNFRNGYSYIGQSALLNDFELFEDYQYNVLSGLRMGSQLDYRVFLNNNALTFSYAWDAYKTGNKLDKFEMSQHVFKLSMQISK